jgi:hypothetical protein
MIAPTVNTGSEELTTRTAVFSSTHIEGGAKMKLDEVGDW